MERNDRRPDPDQLLAKIQSDEHRATRGRLKIFLGYAAGVGKTYALLEAAHQRLAEGMDLVIGYIETHGRKETEALLAGLELIPRQKIPYHGVELEEMDVDTVLARRPRLALVDELAHTNAPGVRHPKRYQDVEELLAAGIDVYTTLNIQHLESLNDVIVQITGVHVHETLPDSALDEATEIEMVDLPAEELLRRLEEGKVYVPEQAARAIQKFFRKGNLTALRELALRRTAERVDDQMRVYMQTRSIPGPWPATERLLVCVSPSPLAERLVRSARRLADELKAEWLAIYVETSDHNRLTQQQRDQIARALLLAEELGAKSLSLPGQSVAETVLDYARRHNITKVIAGKPYRSFWERLRRTSIVDKLIQYSGHIDIYVISSETATAGPSWQESWRPHHPWQRYFWSLLLVTAATGLSAVLDTRMDPPNLVMVYLLGVVAAAAYLGRGPSVLTSILSVLAFDFFFVPPQLTFAVSDTQYLLTFLGLAGVGLVISQLTARVREQALTAQRREADTATLYNLSRDLAAADGLTDILQTVTTRISQTFGREVAIFIPDPEKPLILKQYPPQSNASFGETEIAVATWAYQHGQPAGRGTDTLPAAKARYFPLKTAQGVIGVLGVKPPDPGLHLPPDQRRLLEAFANQVALAIERAQLAEHAHQAQILQVTQKLESALLNSISHDLRTPMVSITGALSSLREDGDSLDQNTRSSILETAWDEVNRLNRLVGNLLSMTRIEANAVRPAFVLSDIQEVIGAALEQIQERLGNRPVIVDAPDDVPMIPIDFVLIVQVLVNLLENALKYSPADSPVEIHTHVVNDYLELEVADRGIGIPKEDLARVFDKFYRVQRPDNVGGTGLGLSICKGIISAHSGFIAAENRPGGGTVITFGLPLHQPEGLLKEQTMGEGALRVLVVDDERAIRRYLRAILAAQGYTVTEAATGKEALLATATDHPDILILDLGLPDIDGTQVTRQLREWTQIPIIILSVREHEQDKINALDAGADDYLTKPFGSGELNARIRVAMRHVAQPVSETVFQIDDLKVDLLHRLVTVAAKEIALTPTEYDLLKLLVQNAGKVITHRQMLRQVWGDPYENEMHLLRVNMSNLRRKIEPEPARPHYILTEAGVGYRLRAAF